MPVDLGFHWSMLNDYDRNALYRAAIRRVAPDRVVYDLGAESHLIFAVDAPRVSAEAVRAAADLAADDEGKLFANDQRAVFTAVVAAKRATTPGSEVELAVDTSRLHFFEPASGQVVDAHWRAAATA